MIYQVYILIAFCFVGSAIADCDEKKAINQKLFEVTHKPKLEPSVTLNLLQKVVDFTECKEEFIVEDRHLTGLKHAGIVNIDKCFSPQEFTFRLYYKILAQKNGWGNIMAFIEHYRYEKYMICEDVIVPCLLEGEKYVSAQDKAFLHSLMSSVLGNGLDMKITDKKFTDGFAKFSKSKMSLFKQKRKSLEGTIVKVKKICNNYERSTRVMEILTSVLDNKAILSKMKQHTIEAGKIGLVCEFMGFYPEESLQDFEVQAKSIKSEQKFVADVLKKL